MTITLSYVSNQHQTFSYVILFRSLSNSMCYVPWLSPPARRKLWLKKLSKSMVTLLLCCSTSLRFSSVAARQLRLGSWAVSTRPSSSLGPPASSAYISLETPLAKGTGGLPVFSSTACPRVHPLCTLRERPRRVGWEASPAVLVSHLTSCLCRFAKPFLRFISGAYSQKGCRHPAQHGLNCAWS